MTDRELLAEYAERASGEAFAELVRRYSGLLYSTCLRILGDAQAAEDAVQAVFLLLVRKSKGLNREHALAGWLVLTARNVAWSSLREARRRKAREEEAVTMVRADGPPANWEDLRPHLDAALASLPPAQRGALVLRYMAGRSRAEAARELGISEEAFSVTASRALDRLRRWFAMRRVEVSSASLCGML